ncbi:MAG: PhoH family protein [Firmicutes bacterium]|nr:PhoH family protein [Bacillota bacterium]
MDARPVRENGAEASRVLPLTDELLYKLQERGEALLKRLEQTLEVRLVPRGDKIQIFGGAAEAERARAVLNRLWQLAASGGEIDAVAINYQLALWEQSLHDHQDAPAEELGKVIYTTPKGKQIRPKTLGQLAYLRAIDKYDVTFGIGPAGTGKTYLAVMKAADALKKRLVKKIVLVRPAVEAGEKLGFLPGDLQEKVNPYLRPIYDALDDVLGVETAAKYMERGLIEVVPLAYMRGRTLDASFIILDEAQNTTPPQMKMFLTRMGMGSKAVITGDITQIDLKFGAVSGLVEAAGILKNIKEIGMIRLSGDDVVRHPLVQKIIEAYARRRETAARAAENKAETAKEAGKTDNAENKGGGSFC